jgi:hypothetical protein
MKPSPDQSEHYYEQFDGWEMVNMSASVITKFKSVFYSPPSVKNRTINAIQNIGKNLYVIFPHLQCLSISKISSDFAVDLVCVANLLLRDAT